MEAWTGIQTCGFQSLCRVVFEFLEGFHSGPRPYPSQVEAQTGISPLSKIFCLQAAPEISLLIEANTMVFKLQGLLGRPGIVAGEGGG